MNLPSPTERGAMENNFSSTEKTSGSPASVQEVPPPEKREITANGKGCEKENEAKQKEQQGGAARREPARVKQQWGELQTEVSGVGGSLILCENLQSHGYL